MKFVKILQENEKHHNFTYQEGYNTELNFDPEIDCNKGLHFCEDSHIKYWFYLGDFYREVITSVNPVKNNNKYKAKTIFVGPKQEFTEEMKIECLNYIFLKYRPTGSLNMSKIDIKNPNE